MTEKTNENIWSCKIGGVIGGLPPAADFPMRVAVEAAFFAVTGYRAEFLFSGWGSNLTKGERAVVNDEI